MGRDGGEGRGGRKRQVGALEVKGGHFVDCSVAIEGEPEGGHVHGPTERLRPNTPDTIKSVTAQDPG